MEIRAKDSLLERAERSASFDIFGRSTILEIKCDFWQKKKMAENPFLKSARPIGSS